MLSKIIAKYVLQGLWLLTFLIATNLSAQNPVKWDYSAKKLNATSYEIHLTATIKNGWHLYSHDQPDGAISLPTTISFPANPIVTLDGGVKEFGNLEKHKDEMLGIIQNQYSGTVDFVQKINLKSKDAKTNLKGTISFQACTDHECLKPVTIDFTVPL